MMDIGSFFITEVTETFSSSFQDREDNFFILVNLIDLIHNLRHDALILISRIDKKIADNREKKISQQMFENIQYDNKQYGMNKGLTIGGKRMTSAKQINNYYDKKAKEAKKMLKNLNG